MRTGNETVIDYHRRRVSALHSERSSWEPVWSELARFIEPTRYRSIDTKANQAAKERKDIIDCTATDAWGTLSKGMHSYLTSPARPWFNLTTFDPEMAKTDSVKTYLSEVQNRMRNVFRSSNVHRGFVYGYGDLGLFGQSASLLVADDADVVRMVNLVHGTFYIARDERGVADTLYRKMSWSVEKIVRRFGYKNCSKSVQNAYDRGNYDDRFDVCHAVEPRHEREKGKIDKRNKPWLSNYWEDGGSTKQMLEESGFDENPIIAPAWDLIADDDYAYSPGMVALGDVKMLKAETRKKLMAIDKKVDPPMTGPTSMKDNPKSLLPGSVTYVDDPGGHGYRPAMEVNLSIAELGADIREVQSRLQRIFFADLFLMLSQMDGIQPRNQMEIAERKEEKMLALGPVLENIYSGQLQPVIDRTFAEMSRRGMLPPPPDDLRGQELKVEYVSTLAQAQKAMGIGSIERLAGFVGNLAGAKPEALDKIDTDKIIDFYADSLGVIPEAVIPTAKVEAIRQERNADIAKAKQAEQAAKMAPVMRDTAAAAKVMSETDTGNGSILDAVGLGGGLG